MSKFKIKKYLLATAGFTVFFTSFWVYHFLLFYWWLKTEGAPSFSPQEIFISIMGPIGNYINEEKIVALYLVFFVLTLNGLFFTDSTAFLVKLKSRKTYATKHIIDSLVFSAIFVLLIEAINVICATVVFGTDIVAEFNLIKYSLIDFVTLFLFYFRIGVLLFIFKVITSKKLSPFIVMGLCFAEFFCEYFFMELSYLWRPSKDAISVIYLLTGAMQPVDTIPMIIRGLIMNIALVVFAYYIFNKKDIIEKKGSVKL